MESEKEEFWNKPSTSKAAQEKLSSDGDEQNPSKTIPEQVDKPTHEHETNECSKIDQPIPEREFTDGQDHYGQFGPDVESERGPTDENERKLPASEAIQMGQHSIKKNNPFESNDENVGNHDTDHIPSVSTSGQEKDSGENQKPILSSKAGKEKYKVNQMQRDYEAKEKRKIQGHAFADIFNEITGTYCACRDKPKCYCDVCSETTPSNPRRNFRINCPLFDVFLDYIEIETNSKNVNEDIVEVKKSPGVVDNTGGENVVTERVHEQKISLESPHENATLHDNIEIVSAESAISADKLNAQFYAPRCFKDAEKNFYDNIRQLYNPSPYTQKTKLEYEKEKLQQFNERAAMKILEKMVTSTYDNMRPHVQPHGAPLNQDQIEFLSHKITDFEKRLKILDRQKKESEREKHFLLEQVNELEMRALRKQKLEVMRRIVKKENPSEKDIEMLEQLNEMLRHQNDCSKELKDLERQNRVMERVMNNAEKELLSSSWFYGKNKPIEIPTTKKEPPPPPPPPKILRFNNRGSVYYFSNKESPSKIPHWTSDRVQELQVKMTSHEDKFKALEEIQDEVLLEEKAEELRKKKQEEKYVKIAEPLDEEDENSTLPREFLDEENKESFDSDGRISDDVFEPPKVETETQNEENKESFDSDGRISDEVFEPPKVETETQNEENKESFDSDGRISDEVFEPPKVETETQNEENKESFDSDGRSSDETK